MCGLSNKFNILFVNEKFIRKGTKEKSKYVKRIIWRNVAIFSYLYISVLFTEFIYRSHPPN